MTRGARKNDTASITAAELRVLEALWGLQAATIKALRDAVYPEGGGSKFATVQKLLARLEEKGLVCRRKDEAGWVFLPTATRDELIGGELRKVASRLSGDSLTPLLTYLVEAGELNSKERAHLRGLLDEAPGANRSRPIRKVKK